MKYKNYPTPSLIAEVFMSTFKISLIIVLAIFIITNVVWGIIYFKPSTPRVGNTHVEITQSGDKDVVKQTIK